MSGAGPVEVLESVVLVLRWPLVLVSVTLAASVVSVVLPVADVEVGGCVVASLSLLLIDPSVESVAEAPLIVEVGEVVGPVIVAVLVAAVAPESLAVSRPLSPQAPTRTVATTKFEIALFIF